MAANQHHRATLKKSQKKFKSRHSTKGQIKTIQKGRFSRLIMKTKSTN